MQAICLGWSVAKEDGCGVYFMCPAEQGEGIAVPAQSVYVPKSKCAELAKWLMELPGVK